MHGNLWLSCFVSIQVQFLTLTASMEDPGARGVPIHSTDCATILKNKVPFGDHAFRFTRLGQDGTTKCMGLEPSPPVFGGRTALLGAMGLDGTRYAEKMTFSQKTYCNEADTVWTGHRIVDSLPARRLPELF